MCPSATSKSRRPAKAVRALLTSVLSVLKSQGGFGQAGIFLEGAFGRG
jgi:hypothetical protein